MKIPGLSFSLRRALGVTALKRKAAHQTGVPLTQGGRERKSARLLLRLLKGALR